MLPGGGAQHGEIRVATDKKSHDRFEAPNCGAVIAGRLDIGL